MQQASSKHAASTQQACSKHAASTQQTIIWNMAVGLSAARNFLLFLLWLILVLLWKDMLWERAKWAEGVVECHITHLFFWFNFIVFKIHTLCFLITSYTFLYFNTFCQHNLESTFFAVSFIAVQCKSLIFLFLGHFVLWYWLFFCIN